MKSTCTHPAARLHTGLVNFPGITTNEASHDDRLWIACCKCGEVIRQAPHALEVEAMFNAQNEMPAAA